MASEPVGSTGPQQPALDYVLAYVVSVPRSGSTLLDNLIAAHPEVVSLGEVHQLMAYALEDRRFYDPSQPLVCTCGEKVRSCAFWAAVEQALGAPLSELHLKSPMSGQQRSTWPRWRQAAFRPLVALVMRNPGLYRFDAVQSLLDGRRIGTDSFRLFDAVHRVTGAKCIVDSSKSPFRLLPLWKRRPGQVRTILLCRDYRAVAHSKMKRGHSLDSAVASWVRWHRDTDALTRRMNGSSIFRLTYERLCEAPDETMRRLWAFLGMSDFETVARRPSSAMHHLGGSPSKRDDTKRKIRLDTEYVHAFSAGDLARLKQLAGPYASRWGYD